MELPFPKISEQEIPGLVCVPTDSNLPHRHPWKEAASHLLPVSMLPCCIIRGRAGLEFDVSGLVVGEDFPAVRRGVDAGGIDGAVYGITSTTISTYVYSSRRSTLFQNLSILEYH